MISSFVYEALPSRVIFGTGTFSELKTEAERLGIRRALVLPTPQQTDLAERGRAILGDKAAGVFTGAEMHTPIEVTQQAVALANEISADCTVVIGGGSTTGLGKAVSIRLGLPQIAVPTTYAGSEMTPILGETEKGLKTTRRDPKILPGTVIYDVDLTMGLPKGLSGTSGINAIAHAVEALYARDRNPIVSLFAEEAIRSLANALPKIAQDPSNCKARTSALYGAWLAGMCLGSVGMALHHKLCHTLGGTFDLPHAETHTVVLPHALADVIPAVPDAAAAMSRALGAEDAALALYELAGKVGAPRSLKELGMPEDGIDRAAELAVTNPYWNPRPLEFDLIRQLLQRAFKGETPT